MFNMNMFCLNMLWVTANTSLSLSKLVATLNHAKPPVSHLMGSTKMVMLIVQWIDAVVHSTTWMSNGHSIYNNHPHLFSTKHPQTLVMSVA
jgi:hypothetical protein